MNIENAKQAFMDILKSPFITILLIILVITLQLDKCGSDNAQNKYFDYKTNQLQDSIITTFTIDKNYFDSAEVSRQKLIKEMASVTDIILSNQSILLSNQEILKNGFVETIRLQKEIIDLANLMKNLHKETK